MKITLYTLCVPPPWHIYIYIYIIHILTYIIDFYSLWHLFWQIFWHTIWHFLWLSIWHGARRAPESWQDRCRRLKKQGAISNNSCQQEKRIDSRKDMCPLCKLRHDLFIFESLIHVVVNLDPLKAEFITLRLDIFCNAETINIGLATHKQDSSWKARDSLLPKTGLWGSCNVWNRWRKVKANR